MARLCSNCSQPGHYASTCKNQAKANVLGSHVVEAQTSKPAPTLPLPAVVQPEPIVAQPKPIVIEEATSEDTPPMQVGLWLINEKKKKIAGKIVSAKSGSIVYEEPFGAQVESTEKRLVEAGYRCTELQGKMLHWVIPIITH